MQFPLIKVLLFDYIIYIGQMYLYLLCRNKYVICCINDMVSQKKWKGKKKIMENRTEPVSIETMTYKDPRRNIIEIFHNSSHHLSAPLFLLYAGQEQCLPSHHFGPAMRGHYLLHFITRGKGRFRVNNQTYELSTGHVFLIKPGESTYYIADHEQPWNYIWFAFDGTESENILKNCGLWEGVPYRRYTPDDSLFLYLDELIKSMQNTAYNDYSLLGYLYLIFGYLATNKNDSALSAKNDYLNSALLYIHNHYSENISVQDISDHIGIDRTYLYRLFMKELSLSPKQYLTQYRLKAASDLLYTTQLPISEIAACCGFSDTSSFGKFFRGFTGFTPRQYRNIDGRDTLSWKPAVP